MDTKTIRTHNTVTGSKGGGELLATADLESTQVVHEVSERGAFRQRGSDPLVKRTVGLVLPQEKSLAQRRNRGSAGEGDAGEGYYLK